MVYFFFFVLLILLLIIVWLFSKLRFASWQMVGGDSSFSRHSLLLFKFPKSEGAGKNFKDEIKISERFFNLLSHFDRKVVFETAVHHVGEEIHFYLAGDEKTVNFVGEQIHVLWPEVQANIVEDYDIFNHQGFNDGVYLKLSHEFSLPIKTYEKASADTFAPILAVLAQLEEIGEGAALQIVLRPADKAARRKIANKEKLSKPLFKVNLRLVASAPSQFRLKEILGNFIDSFSQFSDIRENELKVIKPKNIKDFYFGFAFRQFDEQETMILNSEELASIFHFPISSGAFPRIKWLKSKEVKPPAGLSKRGVVIGENIFRGQVQPINLDYPDRNYHLEILGQPGTGKSTSIINLAIADIKQGKGVAIVDPEGDIIKGVLGNIPEERKSDVIYFDPTDIENPFGLNLLELRSGTPEEKDFIVEETTSLFQKIFSGQSSPPAFDRYLKNSIQLLLSGNPANPATLLDIPRIFTDYVFRHKKIEQSGNAELVKFFKNEIGLHDILPFITSRFNNFIANDYIRPIIGQTRSAFNFRKAIDDGKIILVNLSKSRLGDSNANLLGTIFAEKIALAAFSRMDQPEEQRRPFYFYLDEFHNYITDSLAILLASASKYGLILNMAHRSINELSPALTNLINNFGSIIVFRTGLDDAKILIDKFEPDFSVNDFMNVDNFNAYARILIKEGLSQPFNIRILLPPAADLVLAEEVKKVSRIVYNQNRQKVEMEIYERIHKNI